MKAMHLILGAHERCTVLCILQAKDYTCMLMWSVTCARQVKITMATTYDFMPIATKVHESHMVRIWTMYSHAYFRLKSLPACLHHLRRDKSRTQQCPVEIKTPFFASISTTSLDSKCRIVEFLLRVGLTHFEDTPISEASTKCVRAPPLTEHHNTAFQIQEMPIETHNALSYYTAPLPTLIMNYSSHCHSILLLAGPKIMRYCGELGLCLRSVTFAMLSVGMLWTIICSLQFRMEMIAMQHDSSEDALAFLSHRASQRKCKIDKTFCLPTYLSKRTATNL